MTILEQLDIDGFCTAPLLTPATVSELRALFDSLVLPDDHGFFASSNELGGDAADDVAARITALVRASLTGILPDHEPFLASFLSKGRSHGAQVSFHQDLTYTDEREARTTMVWIPLLDVDARNGAMAVVPGSHRWTSGSRPGGELALPTEQHQDVLSSAARVVPLRAGEALLYDAALVHGSGANTTDESRPAIGIALVPTGTQLIHLHQEPDGSTSAWAVDAAFYTHQSLRERPQGHLRAEVWAQPVDEEVFAAALQSGLPTAEPPARVLKDPAADQDLHRDGFAVIDLPEARELALGLVDFYTEVHGPDGQGFEPDLVNPDRAYRGRVADRISGAFDAIVADRFEDHEPFLRVFLAKWPGPQSDLYLHRDWMYVDERSSGHTYVVWIPLCDVDETNGPLQVLRGSHRLDESPRGTNLNAPWINHHDVVVPRLETVTAPLGTAVVMDNALVHGSLPNLGDRLRLVAAIGLKRVGAPMVHFLRADDDTAWRYDVDESFLMSITPQELLGSPPELPVAERLPAGQLFWNEDELLVALGERPIAPRAPEPPARPTHWLRRARRRLVGRR